jgi:signal transduction histidine kinase
MVVIKNKQYYFNIFKYVFLGIIGTSLSFLITPFLLGWIEIVFAVKIIQFWKTAIIQLSMMLPAVISINHIVRVSKNA